MLMIIICLILIIITSIVLVIDWEEGKFNLKKKKRIPFSLLWLLILIPSCITTIKTGEVGIKTRFGKIVDTSLNEGINYKLPFEKVDKINIKVQKFENKEALETSTKDMQIVNNIKVTINYQVNGKEATTLYRQVGTRYQETILEPAMQETIKGIISHYTAEEIVAKRGEISLDIQDTLNKKTKEYGINIVSVAINNFDFSASYNKAIEDKAVAEQQVQTSKNQLEKAKIDAEKKKVQAQGEAEANKLIEKSLTKEIIQQQFIEKWDGKLPTIYGANKSILDISSLVK